MHKKHHVPNNDLNNYIYNISLDPYAGYTESDELHSAKDEDPTLEIGGRASGGRGTATPKEKHPLDKTLDSLRCK